MNYVIRQKKGTPNGTVVFWWEQDLSHWLDLNSYGAIVAQERQKVDCCNYATRRVLTKRAKMLAIRAKHSTNKGLYVWPFTVKKNLLISPVG